MLYVDNWFIQLKPMVKFVYDYLLLAMSLDSMSYEIRF